MNRPAGFPINHHGWPRVTEALVTTQLRNSRVRLAAAPVEQGNRITNLDPHHGWRIDGLDWERIYRDWDDTQLQFYWQDYPNLSSELIHQSA